MAVLVTGGAGYIGSHMVWELLDHGEEVVVIDRLSTGFAWAVAPQARLIVGDIGDRDLIGDVLGGGGIDAIIHFAGSVVVPESVADPLAYYDNNTCRSRLLIEMAVRYKVPHFIFSSTAAVYGNASKPLTEDMPLRPESPYGRSKAMTEAMLADVAAATGLAFVALRYFNVAGADPAGRTGQSTPGATHLVKVACEAASGKRPGLSIYGTDYPTPDGTCIRDYIHVADLVAAHRLALQHLRDKGESLIANCGYGHGYSVREVIDAVRRASGRDFAVSEAPRRAGDPASVIADPGLIRRKLGWRPALDDLERICADALRWEEYLRQRA